MKFFGRVLLPLILFIYVTIETYLKVQKSSLCSSTGCNLADELLRFDSIYLNYFGGLGALAIAFLGFLSLKRESLDNLFYSVLFAAIAFESVLIGYQIFANPEPCSFCMGVYGQLLLIGLIAGWRYLLYAAPAIVALFISLASLAIPQNKTLFADNGTYLIHSDNCPHCKIVEKFFADEKIDYAPVSIKNATVTAFIKRLNIAQIPVLVVKQGAQTTIIKGDKRIMEYFHSRETTSKKATSQETASKKATPKESTSPQIYNSDDEGCSASIFSDSECSEDSAVPLQ